MVRLYNFGAIESWPAPCVERLHGGTITFRPSYSDYSIRALHKEFDWEYTPLRCLRLCFTHRSSVDVRRGGKVKVCTGVGEAKPWFRNTGLWLLSLLGQEYVPYYKSNLYMRGPLVEKDIRPFNLGKDR